MKKYFVIFGILVVVVIMTSGCTSLFNSNSGVKVSSGGEQKSTIVTTMATTLPLETPSEIPSDNIYITGDIVAANSNEDTSGKIVYDYNPVSKRYHFDTIFKDAFDKWGYRMYPNLESADITWFEDNYPYLIGHIDISSVVTRASSESEMYSTPQPEYTYTSPGYQQSDSRGGGSSGSSGSKQCWVNDYYRKDGTHVNGYYRKC
jgi:hypothetical protein